MYVKFSPESSQYNIVVCVHRKRASTIYDEATISAGGSLSLSRSFSERRVEIRTAHTHDSLYRKLETLRMRCAQYKRTKREEKSTKVAVKVRKNGSTFGLIIKWLPPRSTSCLVTACLSAMVFLQRALPIFYMLHVYVNIAIVSSYA